MAFQPRLRGHPTQSALVSIARHKQPPLIEFLIEFCDFDSLAASNGR